MSQEKILIVDDEKEIAELIRDYLMAEGFVTSLAFDGEEALSKFTSFNPSLVILDIMLPKFDGMEVCRKLRAKSNIPILMLSAKKSDVDKILGLGLGADDYITKPFSPGELMARVKAQLRRYTQLISTYNGNQNILRFSDLEIDAVAYTVAMRGERVSMSVKEFEVLKYLANNLNIAITREQIFNKVWNYSEYGDINTVTVHIRKIREKIEPDPAKPVYIQTVWGVGYKFTGGKL